MPHLKKTKFKQTYEGEVITGWFSVDRFPPEEAEAMALRLNDELDAEDTSVFTGYVPFLEKTETLTDELRLYMVQKRPAYRLGRLVGLGVCTDGFTIEIMKSFLPMMSENTRLNLEKGYVTWDEIMGPSSPSKANARVEKVLSRIYSRIPYQVYYLDPRGLKARFMADVSAKDAQYIANCIFKLQSDTDKVLGPEGLVKDLHKTGRMHLWWD